MPSAAKRAFRKVKKILYRASGKYVHTGERVCPDFPSDNFQNHLKVYQFAGQFVPGLTVLDVGCGSGYGCAHLLERGATNVAGIDYSEEAVKYCKRTYGDPRLAFLEMDAHRLDFPDSHFEVVVSTENLEHLQDPGRNVREIRRVLKRGGILVLGTPNKEMFTPGQSTCSNSYHVKEFYFEELDDLLRGNFDSVHIFENTLTSPFSVGVSMKEGRRRSGRVGIEPGNAPAVELDGRIVQLEHLHNSHSFIVLAW